jgi:Ca2+:H+ antiporter
MTDARGHLANYALPVATFLVALALQFSGLLRHIPVSTTLILSLLSVALICATVFVVLRHAEAIAHRIGEPYGTLVLTFAVTAIEASVIISMMLHGANNPTLARESVFSTVMIVTAGVVGICLTFGGWRHRHQHLKQEGTHAYLSVLIALTVLALVLPNYTITADPGAFSTVQLALVGLLSVLLYGGFVFVQTGRHRGDFVEEEFDTVHDVPAHVANGLAAHVALLLIGLTGIVLLTEEIAGKVEDGLVAMEVSQADALVGAFIATLVLAPEAVSAIRASLRNELQRSLNIALGSACATIGLTIPAVAAASLLTGRSLTLGLDARDTVLLVLALSLSIVSFGTGRTTVLTGLVHLVVFVAYLLLILVP